MFFFSIVKALKNYGAGASQGKFGDFYQSGHASYCMPYICIADDCYLHRNFLVSVL